LDYFRTILIRATNWVGDAVMSIPALQMLRHRFPNAHIAVLARPWVAELYRREPFCDEVILYQPSKGIAGVTERAHTIARLRQRGFDCAILFQNAFEAAAVAFLAGIPQRIGYALDGRSILLTKAVRVPRPGEIERHQRFYYLELIKRSGLIDTYPADSPIRLSHAQAAAERGLALLSAAGLRSPVIGIAPGAAYGGAKRWFPERFAQAAVQLSREHEASVAVFGSKQEREICEQVCERLFGEGVEAVNFGGTTSLSDLINLAAACQVFLTNDSGPMHIASALGVPTIAVFGATDEHATGPTGRDSRVVREPVDCSPCLKRECPIDHRCMAAVSAARVAETAASLISEVRKNRPEDAVVVGPPGV
jgi:heptosyltransferase-2